VSNIVNISWLENSFFRFQKPKNLKSPYVRFLFFKMYFVQFYTDYIQFHGFKFSIVIL